MNKEIKFEIVEHVAVISTNGKGWKKELNLISWNGDAPVYDLRNWTEDNKRMSKGITLTREELESLKAVI